MRRERLQFPALYLTRFAAGFGFVTLVTLLPDYIDLLDPGALELGLFTAGLTIAQTVAVVPLAWGGDRFDKRTVLLGALGASVLAYAAFPFVDSAWGFIAARGLQGVAITGTGLMSLALVGELSPPEARANHIGKANAARFAAGIGGTLSAGALYELFGFDAVFALLVAVLLPALAGVWLFVTPDDTRVEGFPFSDLALNRRLLTLSSFRVQYAVAVTMVRAWVPIYAGVAASRGGLAYSAVAVSLLITAEKGANMVCQPFTGRLSDRFGRALFVFVGGGAYGLVALAVPFSPAVGDALGLPATYGPLGPLSAAFPVLLACNALLGAADSLREPASMALFADEGSDGNGVASSFGVRELVWRPGSVAGPVLGGFLMTGPGMAWVFYVGGAAALTGVATFLGVLSYQHGVGALTEW